MTERPERPRQIASFLGLLLQLSAALGIVGSAAVFLISPRLEPYRRLPEQIDAIAKRLDDLEERTPVLNMIAFTPDVEVEPPIVRAGDAVTLRYHARVFFKCEARIIVRFFSEATRSYALERSQMFDLFSEPIGEIFNDFSFRLYLPESLEVGTWTLTPQIIPNYECQANRRIALPEAHIEVVP